MTAVNSSGKRNQNNRTVYL